MAAHARLKNEFSEDKKYLNLMTWLASKAIMFLSSRLVTTHGMKKLVTTFQSGQRKEQKKPFPIKS